MHSSKPISGFWYYFSFLISCWKVLTCIISIAKSIISNSFLVLACCTTSAWKYSKFANTTPERILNRVKSREFQPGKFVWPAFWNGFDLPLPPPKEEISLRGLMLCLMGLRTDPLANELVRLFMFVPSDFLNAFYGLLSGRPTLIFSS